MGGKTLDELEGVVWGEPKFDSHVVATCCRLRTKPVDEFAIEDFRIMIGQKISLDYLMPLAIVELEREPLAEGDCYPGDLLANVIECGEWFQSHPDLLPRVVAVAKHAAAVAKHAAAELGDEDDNLRGRLSAFLARSPGRTRRCT